MLIPTDFSFPRYLAAKRTVDDRALNRHVWESLAAALASHPAGEPMTVLEIGGGIGTMVERLLEARLLPPAHYILLDAEEENLAVARRRLAEWATAHGGTFERHETKFPFPNLPSETLRLVTAGNTPLDIQVLAAELFAYLTSAGATPVVDLLIAHAFIDLVDVPTTLARLTPILRPGALLYLTINFDGATVLQPEIDPALDAEIERLYHATMDQRVVDGQPSGDSHTGRHLFHNMQKAGIQVLDAGSSDWVVIPHDGTYPGDEAYFLHFIVHTIQGALAHSPALDLQRLDKWTKARHRQIEQGELVYIAHQLDYLGRFRGPCTA